MIDLSKISDLIINTAANDIKIQEIESLMNGKLPNVYKNLLRYTNGFSIGGGLVIYGTDDIVERNKTWEINEYATGCISIGDDGGGNVFLMIQDPEEKKVLVLDAGDMDPSHATIITSDFTKWVNNGCVSEIEQKITIESSNTCNIVITKIPGEGLKDLIKIKNVFGIEISTAALLKGSKNLPFILVERFPSGKAKKLIEKLGPIGAVLRIEPVDEND